jgi:hypothetical protein
VRKDQFTKSLKAKVNQAAENSLRQTRPEFWVDANLIYKTLLYGHKWVSYRRFSEFVPQGLGLPRGLNLFAEYLHSQDGLISRLKKLLLTPSFISHFAISRFAPTMASARREEGKVIHLSLGE